MNTTENNKLIAEFMGFKLQQDPNERWFGQYFTTPNDVWANRIELLHFDTDWNWLVEVVKKCYLLDTSTGAHYEAIYYSFADLDIKKTYNACVEFVKHYNEKK